MSATTAAAIRPLLGWPLLPLPDADGCLNYPDLETSVRQTIQAILATTPGEQLMRPGFGAGLEALLHEPNTLATQRRLRDAIQDALTRWEARIRLDAVEVSGVDGAPTQLRIHVAYRLARTGAAASLGLSVTLEG
ncbi:MAG: hypothetical protein NVS9B10_15520 [Nevskia sp.]